MLILELSAAFIAGMIAGALGISWLIVWVYKR